MGGSFICSSNILTSLEYCPQNVNGNFNCANNQLVSLQHCPQKTSGWFQCNHNNIQNFKFAPQFVGGYFSCYGNEELRSYQSISKLSQLDEYLRAHKEVKLLSEALGQETLKNVIQRI